MENASQYNKNNITIINKYTVNHHRKPRLGLVVRVVRRRRQEPSSEILIQSCLIVSRRGSQHPYMRPYAGVPGCRRSHHLCSSVLSPVVLFP